MQVKNNMCTGENLFRQKPHFIKKLAGFLDILSESLFRRIGISQRLLITFILLTFIPLCVVGVAAITLSSSAVEENISIYSIQILTQVSYNLQNVLKKMEDISIEIMTSDAMTDFDDSMRKNDENARLEAIAKLEQLFENKIYGMDGIASIAFYPSNYDLLARTDVLINKSNPDKHGIFNTVLSTNGRPVWIFMKIKETILGIDTDVTSLGVSDIRIKTPVLFRKISSMLDATDLGVLHIAPKKELLQKICSDIDIGKEGQIILLDSENMVLTGREEDLIGNRIYPELDIKLREVSEKEGHFFTTVSNTRMLVCYNVMEGYNWKVISMIPFENLMTKIIMITKIIFMITLVCVLFALLISYMVTRSVSLPIHRINETFEYLGRGDFTKKPEIKYQDEISVFSIGFNKMIDDMRNLISEVYVTKIKKLDSDFKALQAQINPHFLYNALESINSLAIINNQMEISEMIRGLASVFRYGIRNNNASVMLKDEFEHVRLYILLQALAHEGKIKVEYNADEKLMQAKVLKFMLQPLVENAVIHGLEKVKHGGLIKIEAFKEGQRLICKVSDNGKGMSKQSLNKLRSELAGQTGDQMSTSQDKDSIGLININSRIKLYFGEEYGISVDSTENVGTCVTITIPYLT